MELNWFVFGEYQACKTSISSFVPTLYTSPSYSGHSQGSLLSSTLCTLFLKTLAFCLLCTVKLPGRVEVTGLLALAGRLRTMQAKLSVQEAGHLTDHSKYVFTILSLLGLFRARGQALD